MESIYQILPDSLIEAIAWTLLHSLWQALAIAVLLGLVLLLLRKATSIKRYLFSGTALILFFSGSLFTFTRYYQPERGEEAIINSETVSGIANTSLPLFSVEAQQNFLDGFRLFFYEKLDMIFLLWLAGILVFSLRFLGGIIYTQRLKTFAIEEPPPGLLAKFKELKQKLQISKPVKLLHSQLAGVPMLAGYFRPVILLPFSLMSHVPASQLEAILIHELIHLKRHDNIINILQRLMEILFFFNPALWWISGIIRRERESACDEKALEFYHDKISYARALASVEEFRQNIPVYAAAFSGNKNNLLNRIKRLTMKKQRNNNYLSGLLAVILLFGTLLVFTASGKISLPDGEDVFYNNFTEAFPVKAEASAEKQETPQLPDTLDKQKKTRTISGEADEKMMVVTNEDEKIVKMLVDDKEIDESEYPKHMPRLEKLDEMARLKDEQMEEQMKLEKKMIQEMEKDLAIRQKELMKVEEKLRMHMEKFEQEEISEKMHAWQQEHSEQIEAMRRNIEQQQFMRQEKFREMIEQQQQKLKEVYGDSLFSNNHMLFFEEIEMPEIPEMPEMEELNEKLRNYYNSDEWISLQEEIREAAEGINSEEYAALVRELAEAQARERSKLFDYQQKAKLYANESRAYTHLSNRDHYIKNRFKEELLEDGLIDRLGRSTIELSGNKLYIDGEKQSRKYAKKYYKLYEAISGEKPSDKTVFDLH